MPTFRVLLRSPAIVVAGVCYTAIALCCTQVPLLNYLGFESGFVTALASSLIAGLVTVQLLRGVYRESDAVSRPFFVLNAFAVTTLVQVALLCIPLAVLTANAAFVPNCNLLEGLALYALLPVITVVFATALALFCTVHYRHPRLVYCAAMGTTFVYAGLLGYVTPAIYSYNFFYGFFPGFSYDELLPLGWPLVMFRGVTLCAALVLVWITDILVRHSAPSWTMTAKGMAALRLLGTRYLPVSVILLLCTGILVFFRCSLGWESTASYVQTVLGGRVDTEHFTIYYDPSTTRDDDLQILVQEHEFRLHQVLEAFALPHAPHITSYVYPSAATKRRLIGVGETEITKPWSSEVHITRSSVDDALKHELVHVVAAPFGVRIMHASLSPGLTEGLAVAVEGLWGYRTLPEYAAALRAAGIVPSVRKLMTPAGFMAGASVVSYVTAGAFCRYLIERHGMRPFLQVYGGAEYEAAYNCSLDSLIAAWQRSLDSVQVEEKDRAAVDVIFRRPPIFAKVCARIHARQLREAQKLLQQHRVAEAASRYAALYAEGGSAEAFTGLLTAHFRLGDYGFVTRLYDSVAVHDPVPRRYLVQGLIAGDAALAGGDLVRAESLYAQLRAAKVNLSLTELASERLWACRDSATAAELVPYLAGEIPDTVRVMMLGQNTALPADLRYYIRGRLLLRMRWYSNAVGQLLMTGIVPADSGLEALRRISIGDALVRIGYAQQAREWYWTSLNYEASPYAIALVDDKLARCAWLKDVWQTERRSWPQPPPTSGS